MKNPAWLPSSKPSPGPLLEPEPSLLEPVASLVLPVLESESAPLVPA